MAAESLSLVRTRIGQHLVAIESRAARRNPVDMAPRMAAIRALLAEPGGAAPDVRLH